MKLIKFLYKYSPGSVAVATLAGIVSGVSNAALLALFNAALNGSGYSKATLVGAFVALCLFLPLTRYVSEMLLTKLAQNALFDLRMRLSRQMLGAPLRHLEELGEHRLLAALTDDVPVITGTLVTVPLLCINIAVVMGGLVYLGILNWVVLLAVLGAIVVGVITYQLPIIRAMRHFGRVREESDALFASFRAMTGGAKELKLHGLRREAFLKQSLEQTGDNLRRYNVAGMRILTAAASWGQVLVFVVIGLVLFGLTSVQTLNTAALTGYTITLLYLMTPLQVIMGAIPNLGRANVALLKVERLGLELISKGTEEVAAVAPHTPRDWQGLELVGVEHTYRREGESQDFTLGPINLSLRPGEMVFLTGGNGSGKTTLAKLLVGLYSPESGEIRFNGRPVTDENREEYRQHFSVVFSDFHLFEKLHGLTAPDLDENVRDYLNRLQLSHKVEVKDGKLSTLDLSQGQRKRLALLTAYLEDRPIYLFDEWAADQDPYFKQIFYYQLLPELKARNKTVIVISHDDHYYDVADRLIKLEYGQVDYDKQLDEAQSALLVGPAGVEEQPVPSRT
ncbi:MAG: putative pyoverdin transport system ATP-binding/permease protein [Acidobacteriota bacterium]|jgi:putative ATP-binding cassette transporter|nr:putative pyoverdin transport system ATP-binding/permease protein [Acidobacteriota bacterium]